jgi:hypothetical protein
MNSLLLSFLAAGCTALSSLCFRKSITNTSQDYSPAGYLVIFYFISFIASLLYYSETFELNINFIILSIGACVGFLSSTLMLLTSHALKQGPAGLTFAFQNASAIFPGLILFLLLGSDFGFSCSYLQLGGMAFVLLGLFLGTKKETAALPKNSSKWLTYALACFLIQILALTFIQGRCILFEPNAASGGIFSDFTVTEADDIWFMPGQFGASFLMQAVMFVRENKKFQSKEVFYGSVGGIGNFSSTCLLLLATKFALPFEKGILFPCFAVASMILCNLWANRLYGEKFNIKTNVLCSLGIFMAVAR